LSGGSLVRTFRRFGATPRGSHSQGDAVLLKYIHGRCCPAETFKGDAVLLEYCGEISPAFSLVFQFLLRCDLTWPDLYCVADLQLMVAMLTGCKMYGRL